MQLCRYVGANFGKAAYGFAETSLHGAVPALLVNPPLITGGYFGPNWLDATTLALWNIGADEFQRYDVAVPALTTLATPTPNYFGAGGGVWAYWIAGVGVFASIAIASPTKPLAQARVLFVSSDGQIVLQDDATTGAGISVYDNTGARIYSNPTVILAREAVILHDDLLSWVDGTGSHLVNVVTNVVPRWRPRTGVIIDWVVPIRLANGKLVVLERSAAILSVRFADRGQGFIFGAIAPDAYNPDGMEFSAGIVRAGYCLERGEATATLELFDINMGTGVNTKGVVSGGTVVFSAQPQLALSPLPVGPFEGGELISETRPPVDHAGVDPQAGLRWTRDWQEWANKLSGQVKTLGAAVQNLPQPPAPPPGFSTIVVPGQTSIVALSSQASLTIKSADTSVQLVTDPIDQSVDLSVSGSASTRALILAIASLRA